MRLEVDPIALSMGGQSIRWYAILTVTGCGLALIALLRGFARRDMERQDAEALSFFLLVGAMAGAHLGHHLIYAPGPTLADPARLLLFGAGLSSHGAIAGGLLTTWAVSRWRGTPLLLSLDAALAACLWVFPWVRVGNFVNAEILGRPTDLPWGVVFVRSGDLTMRHPVQLYEALGCLGVLGVALWLERRPKGRPPGMGFFILVGLYAAMRTVMEVFKERLVLAEDVPLSLGQVLSIPLVVGAAAAVLVLRRRGRGRQALSR